MISTHDRSIRRGEAENQIFYQIDSEAPGTRTSTQLHKSSMTVACPHLPYSLLTQPTHDRRRADHILPGREARRKPLPPAGGYPLASLRQRGSYELRGAKATWREGSERRRCGRGQCAAPKCAAREQRMAISEGGCTFLSTPQRAFHGQI